MSKTVKRVMTVMMIGLVALLGAEAEAHTRWFNGKPRTCSICDRDGNEKGATLQDVPAEWSRADLAVAELIVTTKEVTITCGDRELVTLKGKDNAATLIAERLSSQWTYDSTGAHPRFEIASDDLYERLGFLCAEGPAKAQVLKMTAVYRVSECADADPLLGACSSRILLSTMKLNNCKVPLNAALGTQYTCDAPIFEHVHPTPTQ
jgi:hypothetical protein